MDISGHAESRLGFSRRETTRKSSSISYVVSSFFVAAAFAIGAIFTAPDNGLERDVFIGLSPILGMLLLLIAAFTYHLATAKPTSIKDCISRFIQQADRLRGSVVQQGISTPIKRLDHWTIDVEQFLEKHGGERYVVDWIDALNQGSPKERFTGFASSQQKWAWNRITASMEWLQALLDHGGQLPASQSVTGSKES